MRPTVLNTRCESSETVSYGLADMTQSGFLFEPVFIIGSHQEIDLAN